MVLPPNLYQKSPPVELFLQTAVPMTHVMSSLIFPRRGEVAQSLESNSHKRNNRMKDRCSETSSCTHRAPAGSVPLIRQGEVKYTTSLSTTSSCFPKKQPSFTELKQNTHLFPHPQIKSSIHISEA